MTAITQTIDWVQAEKRDRLISFSIAVSIHLLLFVAGGAMFVKNAQFSVQPVSESTDIDLEQMPAPTVEAIETPQPLKEKKEEVVPVPDKIVQGVKVEANPNYFQNPAPPYPELAKQMRQEGLVVLTVDVDRYGVPVKVDVEQSSGFRMLDQAALKAVSHWKFQPGKIGDLPVESTVKVPVRFHLEQ